MFPATPRFASRFRPGAGAGQTAERPYAESMPEIRRIAVVTGSNCGLGLETARQLAACGDGVVLCDLAPTIGDEAQAAFDALGIAPAYRRLDVSDAESVRAFARWLAAEFGGAQVLVNNAGVQGEGGVPEKPEDFAAASVFRAEVETLKRTMDVNAFGAFRMIRALAPAMRTAASGRRPGSRGFQPEGEIAQGLLPRLSRGLRERAQLATPARRVEPLHEEAPASILRRDELGLESELIAVEVEARQQAGDLHRAQPRSLPCLQPGNRRLRQAAPPREASLCQAP